MSMFKNNSVKDVDRTAVAVLGKETEFSGVLRFSRSLSIQGKFDGTIDAKGYLYVEQGAVVNADIRARSAVISGQVRGNIHVDERLEMTSTGRVYGDVTTSALKIADGVIFEGRCEMIKKDSEIKIFEQTGEKLKNTCRIRN